MDLFIEPAGEERLPRQMPRRGGDAPRQDASPRTAPGEVAADAAGTSHDACRTYAVPPAWREESPAAEGPSGRPRAQAACRRPPAGEEYSVAQESYRDELAFMKRRARRKKLSAALRVLAFVILVPVVLAIVFVASYLLTCILNGASPDELGGLIATLVERVAGFVDAALS